MSEAEEISEESDSDAELREALYDQFDISFVGGLIIEYILPILDKGRETDSRYEIDNQQKILAEIALCKAYRQESKLKMLIWTGCLIGAFDYLHAPNPSAYGILFVALATVNGFVSSLRSPAMMVAEIEGLTDENGMPADYRAKALSSVNTNITLVLFIIAVGVQLLVSSGFVEGEVLMTNVADGEVSPIVSAGFLITILIVYNKIRS